MGPFPHDAPAATVSADNPMGTDGFEFVEYAHPKPGELHALFRLMGYVPVARHRTRKITVYRQGDINYLVNEEPGTHGCDFVAAHGPCAPSMAFRVVDAKRAYERALALGAEPAGLHPAEKALDVPAIKGIGGTLLYFVDRYGAKGSAYDLEFDWLGARNPRPRARGCIISTTLPTTSIAAGWMSGPASTRGCSISGRSAFSISRAAPRACSRGR